MTPNHSQWERTSPVKIYSTTDSHHQPRASRVSIGRFLPWMLLFDFLGFCIVIQRLGKTPE